MIDPIQILLSSVIIILTILSLVIGWQLFNLLSETNKMIAKINSMLDGISLIPENVGRSLKGLGGFSQGLKAVLGILRLFKKGEKDE